MGSTLFLHTQVDSPLWGFIKSNMASNQYEEVSCRMMAQLYDRVHYMNSSDKVDFKANEVTEMRVCWNAWVGGDLATRGFEMFCKMFEQHPETKNVFDFMKGSSVSQMQNSSKVLFHVTRVMKYVDEVMKHLDKLDEVVPILRQVGGRHGVQGYNIQSGYFPFLGNALRTLLTAHQKSNYTAHMDANFQKLWNFITGQMKAGQHFYGGGAH